MMMMGDKKKIASVILSKLTGKSNEYEEGKDHNASQIEKGDSGYSEGYEAAASEMLEALDQKDNIKFSKALKHFIQMCIDEK